MKFDLDFTVSTLILRANLPALSLPKKGYVSMYPLLALKTESRDHCITSQVSPQY